MTERERLIELLDKKQQCGVVYIENQMDSRYSDSKEISNKELVDFLIENNVIVPPVKVGDTVYIQYKKKIYPVDVYAIRYDTKTNNKRICVEGWLQIDEWYQHSYSATFKWENVGKTVFLTYEDAEKTLFNKV